MEFFEVRPSAFERQQTVFHCQSSVQTPNSLRVLQLECGQFWIIRAGNANNCGMGCHTNTVPHP